MARNKKARKAKARPLSNHAKEAVSLINTLKETLDNLTKQQLNLASSDQLQRWVGLFAGAYLLDENNEVRQRILGENPVKVNFTQEDIEDAHLNLYAFRFSRMETVTKLNEFYRTIPHELKALMDTIVNAVKAYRRKENTADTLNEHTLFEWGATLTEIFGKCDPIVDASVEMGLKVQRLLLMKKNVRSIISTNSNKRGSMKCSLTGVSMRKSLMIVSLRWQKSTK